MSIGNGVQSVGVGFIPTRRDRYDPSNPVYLAFKPILLFEEPFLEGINPSPTIMEISDIFGRSIQTCCRKYPTLVGEKIEMSKYLLSQ